MNLIFQLSTRIEVYLLIYTVRCPLCETRTEGSIKVSGIYLYFTLYFIVQFKKCILKRKMGSVLFLSFLLTSGQNNDTLRPVSLLQVRTHIKWPPYIQYTCIINYIF